MVMVIVMMVLLGVVFGVRMMGRGRCSGVMVFELTEELLAVTEEDGEGGDQGDEAGFSVGGHWLIQGWFGLWGCQISVLRSGGVVTG